MKDHHDMGGDIRSSVVVAEEGGDKQQQQLVVAADLHYAEKESRLLDMGFTTDLIQRALLIYGTQAAESVLVQFLLDWHENHHHHHQQQQKSGEGNSHGDSFAAGLEVEVAGHSIIAACTHDEDKDTKNYWLSKHSLKSCRNEQRWVCACNMEAATNSVISTVTPFCPTPNTARLDPKEQHNRNLLLTQGFTSGQVEQALQELVARASKRIEKLQIPRRSEGFGLPGEPVKQRYLSDEIKGAPFFYFENVASMPNEDWNRIKLHLFDIEPEYVDSLHFSACRRPRGYIHNLPIEGRKKILPDPPMTIQELMPQTKKFWPAWDPRTKLNCINTRKGSEFLSKKLQLDLRSCLETADPSPAMQQEILKWCREWNLVWTAPNIPTPIAENEMEAMLGFDKDHSRNCYSTRARYKALGNSFSVFTVAFHFSVLKPLYPRGMKILSLFSGIGGAEIALHKIGVKLQVVVSVEIIEGSRRCLEAWWAATKQTGTLDQNHHDVTALGRDELVDLVKRHKGFDLIVGGSPCNNLSGNNQKTRCGIEGPQSNIFFEFSRIVGTVRELMQGLQFSSP
ncbi:unnamed protein product [Sphagnum balticum]